MATVEEILRYYPTFEVPMEIYDVHTETRNIESNISAEKDRLLQIICLIEEYELTLKEFDKIMDIADCLMVLPINVSSFSHLQVPIFECNLFACIWTLSH